MPLRPTRALRAAVAFLLALPAAALARECGRPTAEVYAAVEHSVLRIFAVQIDPFSLTGRVRHAAGTGFVIDERGHVVTNAHLVLEANEVIIAAEDGPVMAAEVVGTDPISDLAVLRPRAAETRGAALPAVTLGNSDELSVGDTLLAIGFPFGIGKTATRGIVSARNRVIPLAPMSWLTPLIQTDAAINPGNSGGPLVDDCGRVVAMAAMTQAHAQTMGFAIPANTVREHAAQIIATGRVQRAWHGIHGQIVPLPLAVILNLPPGLMVETIEPGSPAEAIGLRGGRLPVTIGAAAFLMGGDIITEVNGLTVGFNQELAARIVRGLRVGDQARITYWRDGEFRHAETVLPERPILPGDLRSLRERRSGP